ncbi:MAG: glycosyltransferase [Candidatus Dormibacteraeota bacterium]|nr:glycosyltransferase [Candidatus Dormibacteraeota bacterium]
MEARLRCRVAVLSLHTSPAAAPGRGASGGLNVYVRELTRALRGEGVVSDIFVRTAAGSDLAPQPLEGGDTLIPVPAGSDGDLTPVEERNLVADLKAATTIAALESGHDYDAVASHHWLSGTVGHSVARVLATPLVHTAHTWAVQKNQALAPGADPEPAWRERLEAAIARGADRILVSTPGERQLLDAHYGAGERCSVVVPGVDPEVFTPGDGSRADPPFFLVAGRLERLKGVDTALTALAALPDPTARLVVVGEDGGQPGERDRLRGIARDLGIAARVEFAGSVGREELPRLYRRATGCLFPSYSETFGLVALEALASGTPLVTTRSAGISTIVRDGVSALLVEHDGFEGAMRRLLEDRDLAARLSAEGRVVALRHTWRDTARQWIDAVGAESAREPALQR